MIEDDYYFRGTLEDFNKRLEQEKMLTRMKNQLENTEDIEEQRRIYQSIKLLLNI